MHGIRLSKHLALASVVLLGCLASTTPLLLISLPTRPVVSAAQPSLEAPHSAPVEIAERASGQAARVDEQGPSVKLEKCHPKLDCRLQRLADAFARGGDPAASDEATRLDLPVADGRVDIVVQAQPGQVVSSTELVRAKGGAVEVTSDERLQASAPLGSLRALAEADSVAFVSLPQEPLLEVTGEGVALINADEWHTTGLTGAGVKVAVLDAGFAGYNSLLGIELPSSVVTHSCRADGDITGDGEAHGTAVAEIVHEVAPAAQLYLVNFEYDTEFPSCVDWIISQEVKVINLSAGWRVTAPGDGTGPENAAVTNAVANGIFWANAAGNHADEHWSGNWRDGDGNGWLNWSLSDEGNTVILSQNQHFTAELKWDDPFRASTNDYDMGLWSNSAGDWAPGCTSVRVQDGDDDPVEIIDCTVANAGQYALFVNLWSANGLAKFHLYTPHFGGMEYQVAAGSLIIPADNANAVTAGAVGWYTPSAIEYFSSQGPTDDGRVKPDIVAPDRVSNATYGSFAGTSASSPHLAGAAALVKQANPGFTPPQIKSFLEGRAVDLGLPGKDNVYGSGSLHLGTSPVPPPTVTPTPTPTATPTPDMSQKWVARYDGPNHYDADAAQAVAVDGSRNVYVTGCSVGPGEDIPCNYATAKYDPNGNKLWEKPYPSSGGATDIAVDGDGNVYVTGSSPGLSGASGLDYLTLKYDTNGNLMWETRYDGLYSGADQAYALALDASGNLYVTGGSQDSDGYQDYLTVKYAPNGSVLWARTYAGLCNSGDNFARAIAVDDDGAAYVTGWSCGPGSTFVNYATVRYDSDGRRGWVAEYEYAVWDEARAITLDSDGNVWVTGSSGTGSDDYATVKYDASTGSELCNRRYDSLGDDRANAIAADGSGNVYVTGASGGDYATLKYGPDCSPQWSPPRTYNGLGNAVDIARAIAVDSDGSVYVTGESAGSGTRQDYATVKYGPDGNQVWVAPYNGSGNGDDVASALAVDSAGNVLVTGGSSVAEADGDYATVKYSPAGSELWVAGYDGPGNSWDGANAMTLAPTGDVYVTGKSYAAFTLETDYDWYTVGYDPQDPDPQGNPVWTGRYNNFYANGSDEPWDVGVDGSGGVWVAGRSYENTPSGNGYSWTLAYVGAASSFSSISVGINTPPSGAHLPHTLAVDPTGYGYYTVGSAYDYNTRKQFPTSTGCSATYDGGDADEPVAIAVDADENVYVTGWSWAADAGYDYATVKYDANCNPLWASASRYNGGGDDLPRAIAVDSNGNVYVTGQSEGSFTGLDYATVKYGPGGNELWANRYNGTDNGDDMAYGLGVDGLGNVYVAGESAGSGTGQDYATVKYGPGGNELWAKSYNGSGNGDDIANAMTLDSSGRIYVTGKSWEGSNYDYVTLRYSAAGALTWEARYDGPGHGNDEARDIAVDGSGNVYVTGASDGSDTDADYATIMYATDTDGDTIPDSVDPDDDNDSMLDTYEQAHACLKPAVPDALGNADGDKIAVLGSQYDFKNFAEMFANTDPCVANPGAANDSDGDAFSDGAEPFLGTDPMDACPDNPSDDAWPPDINTDTKANILDVLLFKPVISKVGDPNYNQRYDLNADGKIDILDVLLYKPIIMTQCTNP